MPRQDLMELVLRQFAAGEVRTLDAVVAGVTAVAAGVPETDVRSAVLSLLRRNELHLTEQFELQHAGDVLAA